MNAISGLLARAKAAAAPRIDVQLTRRVRSLDRSSAPGAFVSEEDGWVFWLGDDGFDHLSRADFLEPETR